MFAVLLHLLLVAASIGWSQEIGRVEVRMDCREGIGLIPSVWSGGAISDGELPEGIHLRTVRLGPALVKKVWETKLAGGDYSWSVLDALLDTLKAGGTDVLLAVPVPGGEALVDLWPELVYDLASRTYERVSRFEIFRGEEPTGGNERYLEFYESAVWSIYRADRNAQIGGPGTVWPGQGPSALVAQCAELDLPLHFVSWHIEVKRISDLTDSVSDARNLLEQHQLGSRPELVISRWQAITPEGSDSVGLEFSVLRSIVDLDLDAACMDLTGSDGSVARAFDRLGRVRVGLELDENDRGLEAIGSLEGEDALALLWGARDSVQVDMTFAGVAWGKEIRIRRSGIFDEGSIEDFIIPMSDPARVSFFLGKDEVSLVWLHVVE
jgi:hypothetical protein